MFENYQDVLNQLQGFGLLVDSLNVDTTRMQRVRHADARDKKAGWYKLNTFNVNGKNYLVGSFGVWHGNENNTQKVEWDKSVVITKEQKMAMAEQYKNAKKQALANRKIEKKKLILHHKKPIKSGTNYR